MTVNSKIELTDSEGVALSGVCRDLSSSGMQIFVEREFAEGEELHTLIPAVGEQVPPLETVCRVLRCEPESTPESEGYLLGVEITEMKR